MERIKAKWAVMLTETKNRATERVMKKYDLSSVVAFRQNWIYQGRIPEAKKAGVLEIFEEELENQKKSINSI